MHMIRLTTLAPGHFHAALVHKTMPAGVASRVFVYGPIDAELLSHLQRLHSYNSRSDQPTNWEIDVRASSDWLTRFRREAPGTVAILAGRNRTKLALMHEAVTHNMHVLADKPWILELNDLPKVEDLLYQATLREVQVGDMMTERYEITSQIQRELLHDAEIFGEMQKGTATEPAVFMESVHYLKKQVSGQPLRRPDWFFDIHTQGEGLTDVGTHLVDLVMWLLFPRRTIDYRHDVNVLSASRWPTLLTRDQFEMVTGHSHWPDFLGDALRDDRLHYFCNNRVTYQLRGVHVRLDVLWDYESEGGGDTHQAMIHGSRSRISIRQGNAPGDHPELYISPSSARELPQVRRALERRVQGWEAKWPGLRVHDLGMQFHLSIPMTLRVGHEAHFARVIEQYLQYLWNPRSVAPWEWPNLLAKYYTTTKAVAMARES